MRRIASKQSVLPPAYVDGVFSIYDEKEACIGDYPVRQLSKRDIRPVWYRELAVYDDRRALLQDAGKEITMRIAIPQWRGPGAPSVRSHIEIDGMMHEIYNVAHVVTRNGFAETELTLCRPVNNMQIEGKVAGNEQG